MDVLRLKKVMKVENKRVIDIASETRLSEDTIRKFLRDDPEKPVSPAVSAAIKRYLDDKDVAHARTAKAVAG